MIRYVALFLALLTLLVSASSISAETDGWQATYYPNPSFEGDPILVRTESAIDASWGAGAPEPWFPSDNFSVRWTRQLTLESAGLYTISARADDGLQVLVDGNVVLDATETFGRVISAEITLSPGPHTIVVNYVETVGDAFANVTLAPISNGDWVGQYFNNRNLTGDAELVRRDPKISFNWGNGRPAAGINADNFSARWTKTLSVAQEETYCFRANADDGVRVFVDGERIINDWSSDGAPNVGQISLDAGTHEIRVDYRERTGNAFIYFSYFPLSQFTNPAAGAWRGTFYNNTTATGCPVATAASDTLSFDWADAAPQPGVRANNWSSRWLGGVVLDTTDTYCFTLRADDGARLWVDNFLLLDGWTGATDKLQVAGLRLAAGYHTVRVEYVQRRGPATLDFDYFPLSPLEDVFELDQWHANYFNGRSPEGCPTATAKLDTLNVSWGEGSPTNDVASDRFSASFTKRVALPETTTYCFSARADHGVRVFVDGERVINARNGLTGETVIGSQFLTAGEHDVRVEYNELNGVAFLAFDVFPIREIYQNSAEPNQWLGFYYNNRALRDCPALVRSDAELNFNWGSEGPSSVVSANNFSAQWRKGLQLPEAATYCFTVAADQGVRVYANGERFINAWGGRRNTNATIQREVDLKGGYNDLRVEYYETTQNARISVNYAAGECE